MTSTSCGRSAGWPSAALPSRIPVGCAAAGGAGSPRSTAGRAGSPRPGRTGSSSAALRDAALPAMRERGQVISALYPSVVGLYRGRGWEQVGVTERVELAPATLQSVPPPGRPVPLHPAGVADLAALHDCYQALGATVDGLLDRGTEPFDVSRVLELDIVTVAPGPAGLRGYMTAARRAEGLAVYDLVAHDADAWRVLLRSAGSWAGQLHTVSLRLLDSRLLSPAPLGIKLNSEPWMLRVVDLPAAVAARGWPRAGQLRRGLSVEIELVDQHAPWHAGRHRLVVDGDRVLVTPGT